MHSYQPAAINGCHQIFQLALLLGAILALAIYLSSSNSTSKRTNGLPAFAYRGHPAPDRLDPPCHSHHISLLQLFKQETEQKGGILAQAPAGRELVHEPNPQSPAKRLQISSEPTNQLPPLLATGKNSTPDGNFGSQKPVSRPREDPTVSAVK